MISNSKFVIGVDFGTDSVRALLVDASNGQEVSNEVFYYTRWKQNLYCDPKINQYRQHPLDHKEGLEFVVKSVVKKSEVPPELIKSICIGAFLSFENLIRFFRLLPLPEIKTAVLIFLDPVN